MIMVNVIIVIPIINLFVNNYNKEKIGISLTSLKNKIKFYKT